MKCWYWSTSESPGFVARIVPPFPRLEKLRLSGGYCLGIDAGLTTRFADFLKRPQVIRGVSIALFKNKPDSLQNKNKERRKAGAASRGNDSLGFERCLGEVQQQSVLPTHGLQLGANDRKVARKPGPRRRCISMAAPMIRSVRASCSKAMFLLSCFPGFLILTLVPCCFRGFLIPRRAIFEAHRETHGTYSDALLPPRRQSNERQSHDRSILPWVSACLSCPVVTANPSSSASSAADPRRSRAGAC